MLLASRALIEGHVRRRVIALANVIVCERCDVVDLLTSSDHERVTGVREASQVRLTSRSASPLDS